MVMLFADMGAFCFTNKCNACEVKILLPLTFIAPIEIISSTFGFSPVVSQSNTTTSSPLYSSNKKLNFSSLNELNFCD